MRRTAVLVSLAVVAAGFTTLGLSSPAQAAVTSSTITSPVNGTHHTFVDDVPHNITVSGTSNGTAGVDQVALRCYYRIDVWRDLGSTTVGAGGAFSMSADLSNLYGTCVLRAVPPGLAKGASTSAFPGPRITVEWNTPYRISGGPNDGRLYDYYVAFQASNAFNDFISASSGGMYDSRLSYSNGYSSNYLWYGNGALYGNENGAGRSELKIDGRNAFGPNSAHGLFTGAQDLGGLPSLSYTATRNATTGTTTIHEVDPIVRCNTETFPPTSVSCTSFVSTGVRLERTMITDDGGRQTHMRDVWRSTDGHAHTVSAHYEQAEQAYDLMAGAPTAMGLKLPWLSSAFQTFTVPEDLGGINAVPQTLYVRDNNAAANGNTDFPRGAITFDSAVSSVRWASNNTFIMKEESLAVPAGGTRTVRHDYVMGTSEAEIAAKAAASRVRINPRRPDGLIRKGSTAYVGNNIYNTTGAGQTATAKKKRGKKATFYALIQNDGTFTDTFKLKGTGNKKGFTVSYFAGTKDITSKVEHGTYSLSNLAPGQQRVIKVVIKVKATAKKGALRSWLITSTSTHDTTSKDTVRANVRVRK